MSDDQAKRAARREKQLKQRGSRLWFEAKLNEIESSFGFDARAIALKKWASIVYTNQGRAGFEGADWLDRIRNLYSIASSIGSIELTDTELSNVTRILQSGNDDEILKLESLYASLAEHIDMVKEVQDPKAQQKIFEIIRTEKNKEKLGHLIKTVKEAIPYQLMTDDQIKSLSNHYYTREAINSCPDPDDDILESKKHMQEHVDSLMLNRDQIRRLDNHNFEKPIQNKLRRMMRLNAKQAIATLNLTLQLIGKDGQSICSDFELSRRHEQKDGWTNFGKKTSLTRNGQSISMLDVMQSASNCRMAEIYALTRGLEQYAKANGLVWAFITITTPPRMHSNPDNGNCTYDGTKPSEAHKWLHKNYHKVEARLRTKGIILSGLRVSESHEDSTPHWHAIIFYKDEDCEKIKQEFRKTAPEWKKKAGFDFLPDDGRATASSYMLKYIEKTIGNINKVYGEKGKTDAWRSTWAIRAFQFFGLPALGLWRALRSIDMPKGHSDLEGMWEAANTGNGAKFIDLAGGLNVKQKNRPIHVKVGGDSKIKTIDFTIAATGEIFSFVIEKWQKEQKQIENTRHENNSEIEESIKLEVNLNYPRKSESKPETAETTQNPLPESGCKDASTDENIWKNTMLDENRRSASDSNDKQYVLSKKLALNWRSMANPPNCSAGGISAQN